MSALRRTHRLSSFLALVGLLLASALVSVGAHEHDLWGGDTPDGVVCVVDHARLADSSKSDDQGRAGMPALRSVERPHRHVCVGLHATTHPPAAPPRSVAIPRATPSVVLVSRTAALVATSAALAHPDPRGPPRA